MSIRCERWLSLLCLTAACGLILAAAYVYFSPPPVPVLQVAKTDIEVPEANVGSTRDVVYRLENPSRRPIRICGVGLC